MMRLIFCLTLPAFLTSCTYYLGPNRWENSFNDEPFVVPHKTAVDELPNDNIFVISKESLAKRAKTKLTTYSTKFEDTTLNVRVVYEKLLLGDEIEKVNNTILKFKAWGTTGTSSKLNKKGDYDFAQIQFINLVWYFKDSPEILFPATAEHIIHHLIIDNGSKNTPKAPKVFGLIRETENHILMKEISRYLKNQWLFEQDGLAINNNSVNGMKDFLIEHLTAMKKTGFYEFNANPYLSYTFEALHVLYNHSKDPELQQLSKEVMDAENWQYALGSYQLKKYSPFRRRMSRVSISKLYGDRHGVLIRVELAKSNKQVYSAEDLPCCFDRTIITATSAYRLPIQTKAFIDKKPNSYYAKIGHGLKASPEIYYGTSSYLMSAGGLRFGKRSQIVPRPLSLFLNDDAKDIKDCFHIEGNGKLNNWNNTGVYPGLMVGKHAVHIPSQYHAIDTIRDWQIYKPYSDKQLFVCVLSQENLGIIYIGNENYTDILLMNPLTKRLQTQFSWNAQETIKYKLSAKRKWVIKKAPSGSSKRKFKKWRRFDIDFGEAYSSK